MRLIKYAGTYYSPFKIKKLLEELDELIEKIVYNLLSTMWRKKLKVTQ